MKNILLLHGALGCKDQFDLLAEKLGESFLVHTLNFSGHGGLPADNKAFSLNVFCADVISYLESQEIDNIYIFGYSMGGYVALSLADKYPGLVKGIFTLATKFDWSPELAAKETSMLNPEKIEQKVPAFADELQKVHSPTDWKVVMKKTAEFMIALGNDPLNDNTLEKINCPVRIAVGDRDKMVGIEPSLNVYRKLPKGSFLVLPETSHPFENVDQLRLASELNDFFLK